MALQTEPKSDALPPVLTPADGIVDPSEIVRVGDGLMYVPLGGGAGYFTEQIRLLLRISFRMWGD
ncbi:MAG: hypothetical protein WAT84_04700 [Candidatus Moraniibacteriota bacterium]